MRVHKRLVALLLAMVMTVTPFISFAAEETGTETQAPDTPVTVEQVESEEPAEEPAEEPEATTAETQEARGAEEPAESGNEEPEMNPEKGEPEDLEIEDWVAADFTYGDYEELIYGCDYTRQIIISGKVVTGFSEQGEAKLANRKDLVLPSKDTEGNTLVGVGANAFKEKGLTSVKFPTGMMVSYDDTITNRVTKRGNYVIAESAFAKNELTSVYLPSGVLAVMPNAFMNNKITKVTLPRTIWWVETLAFAKNQITKVSFPSTTDFLFEMHGMAFADNQITSVTIPDYVEVINKHVFVLNPGMEPCDPAAGEQEVALGGVVYMYTDNMALMYKDRIHHVEKLTESQKSWHQKLIVMDGSPETENPDTDRWNTNDFTFDGQTVTGLSESGIAKRSVNKDLVIPDFTPDFEPVTALADAPPAAGGLFATQTEKFDSVRLPVYLKKIGNNAFRESGIEDVVFPEELEEIGTSAFLMNNLSSVILPDSVNSIGNGAFATNPKIERINLSSSLTVIPEAAFGCSDGNYMPNLTEIDIPDSVTRIEQRAFAGNNFREIDIPESVTSIDEYAFSTRNYLLEPCTLNLPEGLQTIGECAFRNKIINNVKLPTTVTGLPKNVFLKAYSNDFPVTVTKVYVTDFGQYSDEVNFPPSDTHELIYIGSDKWVAEDFTYGTRTLTQSDYVTKGNDTESCLTGDIHVITGFSEEGLNKLAINTDLVIPAVDPQGNKVQGIENNAFKSMGLTSLTLPVTERVEDTEAVSKWDPDATMRGDFFIMNFAFSGNELQTVDIPEGVLFIASGAFKDNKLTSIKLPSSLMVVSSQAFASNTSGTTNRIASVSMPETTDFPIFLGMQSFSRNKIKTVQLPAETIVVNKFAFFGNTGKEPGIVYMYIEDTEPSPTIAHLDGVSPNNSTCQKLFAGQTAPPEDAPWNANDFTYNERTITGLSETGKLKIKNNSNLVIPEQSPDGVEVTAIGDATVGNIGTFGYKLEVENPEDPENPIVEIYAPTSVIFPSTLTKIGKQAFEAYIDTVTGDQVGLTSVTFPEGLQEIGIMAFRWAPLTSVRLPDSVTTLGSAAFTSADVAKVKLKSVKLSDSLTQIPASAFQSHDITELVLPSGITSVGGRAFAGSPLTSLVLNDQLTTINTYAFAQHQLTSVVLPPSVKTIGTYAFAVTQDGRPNTLKELVLNDGLTSVSGNAFNGSILKVVDLPETVTTLNKDAFKNNNSGVGDGKVILRTLNEDQAQAAGDYTKVITNGSGHVVEFDNMTGTGWNKYDFTYSEDETTITGWSESGNQKRKVNHDLVLPNTSLTGVAITEIGDAAFQSPEDEYTIGKFDVEVLYGIETVKFPEGLQKIGNNAFEYNNLESVPFDSVPQLTEIGTSAFHGNKISSLTIPNTVTTMGPGVFSMNSITELQMSDNVTVIPQGAFSMNIRLDNITIPDTVTEIEGFAFAGARLTTLEIPASVEKVGEKAFHLHHLQNLTIPGTLKEIGDNAFEGTYKATTLQTLVLEEGIEKIGSGAFKEGLLEEVALPMSLTEMGNEPFQNNAGKNASGKVLLTTENPAHLQWEDATYHTIKLIGYDWVASDFVVENGEVKGFSDQGKEKATKNINVIIPAEDENNNAVTSIAAEAFNAQNCVECASIKSVVIPDSVTNIGNGAFANCSSLVKFTLPKNMKSIPDSVFAGTGIKHVVIPEGIKSIGNNAFAGAPVTKITWSSTLETIGNSAFANHRLITLAIPANVKSIGDEAFNLTDADLENSLAIVVLNEGLESIGSKAFGRSILTSVQLPSSVTSLNKLAFAGSTNVVDVNTENINMLASDNPEQQLNIVLPIRTVTFETSYGTVENTSLNTTIKGVLTELNDPNGADSCNTFEGWFMEDDTQATIDTVYSKDTVLTAKWNTSHEWGDWEIVEPTTDSEGSMTRVCNKNPEHVETVVIPKITYEYTGDQNVWKLQDTGELAFSITRSYKDEETITRFVSVKVDDVLLTEEQYSVEAGSLVVKLKDTYLNTLARGEHTISVDFDDKADVSTTFAVQGLAAELIPQIPRVRVKLYGHDDLHAYWENQVVEGFTVKYKVEYKRSTWSSYRVLSSGTTRNFYKKANLVDGAKYRFKVTPYVEKDGVTYSGAPKYSSYIYTLKKLPTPRVVKVSRNYVRVRWTNIPGESGYQIVRSRYKTKGFTTIRRPSYKYSSTSRIKTVRNRTYYYKIRAYKNVDGKRIYGPWSNLRAYKLR